MKDTIKKRGVVSLSHLTRQFKDHHGNIVKAVDDFSCEINAGEFVTILGPSGCGKTTVLRMIAGFENLDDGSILLDGTSINHLPPNKRNSAMVFQNYAVFPHMNVEENITYGLKIRKLEKDSIDKKLRQVIKVTNLMGFEKRKPTELSGGQQQRVALARALIVEPDLLLFDEPLSNLDAKLRESMRFEIRRIQRELKITTIYVTHDQSEALAISDRIIIMNHGKIEQIGTPQEIYTRPSSLFIADFIGNSNFIPGKVVSMERDAVRIKVGEHHLIVPYVSENLNGTSDVTVIARPENTEISSPEDGTVKGELREINYLGNFWEYKIISGSRSIVARTPAKSLDQRTEIGSTVGIRFSTKDLHYLRTA